MLNRLVLAYFLFFLYVKGGLVDPLFMLMICFYMLVICMNIFMVVYVVISRTICLKKDMLYVCLTKIQRKNKKWETFNGKFKPNLLKDYST